MIRKIVFVSLGILTLLVLFGLSTFEVPIVKIYGPTVNSLRDNFVKFFEEEKYDNRHDNQSLSSTDCSVRFAAPSTFPMVMLLSIPGSGNTWTRHLIEQATGFYTGSIYKDRNLYAGGWNRQGKFKHYEETVNKFLELQVPTLIVHYENMKTNLMVEVRRIVGFLNMTLSRERAMCVKNNAEGNFHRKPGDVEAPYEAFTDLIKCNALDAMRRVSTVLVKKGHDPLPCLQEHPVSGCDLFSKAVLSNSNCTADNSTLS